MLLFYKNLFYILSINLLPGMVQMLYLILAWKRSYLHVLPEVHRESFFYWWTHSILRNICQRWTLSQSQSIFICALFEICRKCYLVIIGSWSVS